MCFKGCSFVQGLLTHLHGPCPSWLLPYKLPRCQPAFLGWSATWSFLVLHLGRRLTWMLWVANLQHGKCLWCTAVGICWAMQRHRVQLITTHQALEGLNVIALYQAAVKEKHENRTKCFHTMAMTIKAKGKSIEEKDCRTDYTTFGSCSYCFPMGFCTECWV